MKTHYDTVVIGGGPGGYTAAVRAANHGQSVLLAEARALGGTCLNRGCIPTKALLQAAHGLQSAAYLAQTGITFGGAPSVDFAALAAYKTSTVDMLRKGVDYLLSQNGVEVFAGRASFESPDRLALEGTDAVTFTNAIIATGSAPSIPPVPGLDSPGVYTSDDFLAMETYPESVVILGGGVIGVEFASILSAFGAKVTVVEMMDAILPEMDEEISAAVMRRLKKEGVTFHTGARLLRVENAETSETLLTCTVEKKEKELTLQAAAVLAATGRKAYTEGLGLQNAGLAPRPNGSLQTDEQMRTSAANIYAIGDVTGQIMLAHVASAQGCVAADAASGKPAAFDGAATPFCVYTNPEVACVGMTEAMAEDRGIRTKTAKTAVRANGKSLIMGEKDGFVKLVADAETGKLLGAHMCAPRASDMIAELCLALNMGCDATTLANTIHPHPTVSELVMETADALREALAKR